MKGAGMMAIGLALALAGCAPDPRMPYLGRWIGSMDVTEFHAGAKRVGTPAANRMEVQMQLYATENRVVMLIESKAQLIEARGRWAFGKKEGIVVSLTAFKNDDRGGEEFRNPSLPFMDDPTLTGDLKAPLIFRREGKGGLRSLPFSLGDAVRTITVRKDTLN